MNKINAPITIDMLTDSIMAVVEKEVRKIQTRISEERGIEEISFIDIGSFTNRIMMAMDREFRKAELYTFQGNPHYEVRPTVELIVAVILADRELPSVAETRPTVRLLVASLMADHAAYMAVEDAL